MKINLSSRSLIIQNEYELFKKDQSFNVLMKTLKMGLFAILYFPLT